MATATQWFNGVASPYKSLGNGGAIQDLSKLDVVGNALGLPHFGDARHYAPDRPTGPGSVTDLSDQSAQRAAGFFNQVPGYDAREAAAYGQEGQLANTLQNQISGTGPTVAGTQLATGLDQGQHQQLAQAAGASGNNAALARMAAMGNTANMAMTTNQNQATARAGEQQNALNQLAGVTGNMQNQSMAMGGQKIGAADTLNQMALGGKENVETSNTATDAANAAADQAHKDGILNTFGSIVKGKVGF